MLVLVHLQPIVSTPVAVSHQAHQFVASLPPAATTDGEQRTLRALADFHWHRSGLIYPNVSTLTGRTGFDARTLRRHLTKFQEQGWLVLLDRRRQVFAFPSLLKTPWKTCGKPVEALPGGSAAKQPPICEADPGGPLLALCDAPTDTCGADQDLYKDPNRVQNEEGAAAPAIPDDAELRRAALERARLALKVELPTPNRRRRRA